MYLSELAKKGEEWLCSSPSQNLSLIKHSIFHLYIHYLLVSSPSLTFSFRHFLVIVKMCCKDQECTLFVFNFASLSSALLWVCLRAALYSIYSPPLNIILFNARVRIDVLFFSVEIECRPSSLF